MEKVYQKKELRKSKESYDGFLGCKNILNYGRSNKF